MEELYVQHGEWFEIDIEGISYRCMLNNYGLTYSYIEITTPIITKKKLFIFFGPTIERKKYVNVTDFKEDGRKIYINRQKFYRASGVRVLIEELLKEYNLRINKKHSYKI